MAALYEIRPIVALLEQEWDSAEDMAKAIVKALDEARASRTRYIAVMQFGSEDGKCWYVGLGPYPGGASAKRAVQRHPGATLAHRCAVVPVTSGEGLEVLLKEVG